MADRIIVRGAEKLQARLQQLGQRIEQGQGQVAKAAGDALGSFMVQRYLSGGRLKRISGHLAGSWARSRPTARNAVILGTPFVYGAAQEFGVNKVSTVREHTRRGRNVKQHTRMMKIRAKHYVRDTLRYGEEQAIARAERKFRQLVRKNGE